MSQNPYPTKPGFGLRVHHAKQALKKLAAEPWNRRPVNTRGFDNCFEYFDGAAVVWALMHAAQTDSALAEGIALLGGPSGHMQERWRRVYGQSVQEKARQLSLGF